MAVNSYRSPYMQSMQNVPNMQPVPGMHNAYNQPPRQQNMQRSYPPPVQNISARGIQGGSTNSAEPRGCETCGNSKCPNNPAHCGCNADSKKENSSPLGLLSSLSGLLQLDGEKILIILLIIIVAKDCREQSDFILLIALAYLLF